MYNPKILNNRKLLWHHGVVVINTVQLRLPIPKIRFCAGSNPGGSLAMVPDGSRAKLFKVRSTLPEKQFIIIYNII